MRRDHWYVAVATHYLFEKGDKSLKLACNYESPKRTDNYANNSVAKPMALVVYTSHHH